MKQRQLKKLSGRELLELLELAIKEEVEIKFPQELIENEILLRMNDLDEEDVDEEEEIIDLFDSYSGIDDLPETEVDEDEHEDY